MGSTWRLTLPPVGASRRTGPETETGAGIPVSPGPGPGMAGSWEEVFGWLERLGLVSRTPGTEVRWTLDSPGAAMS